MTSPLAYFLTWTTYATWLPGDDRGSTDHARAEDGPRRLQPNPKLELQMRLNALPAIRLDREARNAVDAAIRSLASEKRWQVHALNVRSNHVHLVVTGEQSPERVMVACKAAATKHLRQTGLMTAHIKVWTRHGSTRWINNEDSLEAAVRYTLEQQDNPARFSESRGLRDRYDDFADRPPHILYISVSAEMPAYFVRGLLRNLTPSA